MLAYIERRDKKWAGQASKGTCEMQHFPPWDTTINCQKKVTKKIGNNAMSIYSLETNKEGGICVRAVGVEWRKPSERAAGETVHENPQKS